MKKLNLFAVMMSVVILSGCTWFQNEDVARDSDAPVVNDETTPPVVEEIASKLCTDEPTTTEIGRDIYPIDPKYGNLDFLGQLFTAYNCGEDRVSKIFGVEGDDYTLGSTILLKGQPSQELIETYLSIGFECTDVDTGANCKSEEGAKQIDLSGTVKVEDLMKLEPFVEYFESDGCVNCG